MVTSGAGMLSPVNSKSCRARESRIRAFQRSRIRARFPGRPPVTSPRAMPRAIALSSDIGKLYDRAAVGLRSSLVFNEQLDEGGANDRMPLRAKALLEDFERLLEWQRL